ncbi:DGQHR domain-containing protein [Pseudoalteromonas ruthenica]|uniref:DGQHR domain-containing protein n=1 Tax=Pseudoalteromonas ruthenica TaxID=151081 RepID=UPI00148636C7|nr:DGQHR domain-containing protein [Pseudoalteromonas ruthenica]
MTSNTNQQKVNDIVKGLLDAPEKTAFIAIKGKQGKHDVFTLMMPLSVLAELFEADVGAAFERSQRPVNKKRALGVTNYIRENCSNYVLPSLTASIEDFTPSPALNFGSIYNDDDFKTDTCRLDVDGFDSANVVALNVPKTSRWWFIDGQHRATGTH